MNADLVWDRLSSPWQRCLEEAWQSWAAGSAGVGCVVVDGSGAVVATGRNRVAESKLVPHDLAETPIAHAEMVALSTLPFGDYSQHTLLSTFEPCLMCASSVLFVGIGTVEYASPDPVFEGLHDWFGELAFSADRRPTRRLLGGEAGTFAHLLHVSWLTFWLAEGPVVDAHLRAAPLQLDAARSLVDDPRLRAVAEGGGGAHDALAAVWDIVEAATPAV